MKRYWVFISISLFLLVNSSTAQVGGESTYSFLNLTTNPRVAALGGKIATLDESDLGSIAHNPALLNPLMHNQIIIAYVGYYADIKYGSFLYARDYHQFGTFALGANQVNYGSFIEADATGEITGKFYASDLSLNFIWAKAIDSTISIGACIKPIFSYLERYNSWGIAVDFGANYLSPNKLFSAGIAIRNAGTMLKTYTSGTWEKLPVEVIAGFSKKLGHAPFRFIGTFHQLQNFDIYYQRENQNSSLGANESQQETKLSLLGREVLSHVILGFEFQPVKSFYFRLGYNYQRRNEMRIVEKSSTVGFSWGFGIRISKFQLSYSQNRYHLAGTSNHFAISTDLDDLFGWKKL